MKHVLRVVSVLHSLPAIVAALIVIALCPSALCDDAKVPTSAPSSSPDAMMWAAIEQFSIGDAAATGHDSFPARIEHRTQLLQRLRAYRAAYPGAAQADEACRRELATMFELGVLNGGAFDEFQNEVAKWMVHPPSDAALHEAAYWQIELRSTRGEFGNVRIRLGETSWEPARLDAYREYVQKYPRSRHVPKLAAILYDDAARLCRREEMQGIVAQLRQHWPDSGVVEQLSADLRRRDAVGKPFALRATGTTGEIDTASWRGQPVVLVVWTSSNAADREVVSRVESERANRRELRVVGINLDQSTDAMNAAVRNLRIDWPQVRDARGWAGEFMRTWGVRSSPFVFVIDARGNLVGTTAGDDWLRWLDDAAR